MHQQIGRWLALALACALCACSGGGGGGGGGYCVGSFEGGLTDWACTSCSGIDPLDESEDFAPARDNDSGTSRAFGLDPNGSITIRAYAPEGMSFPAGVDAGALIRFPTGSYPGIGVRFNAYRNGVLVDEGTGGAVAANGNVPGAGEAYYYSVEPTLEFDRLDAIIQVSGNVERVPFRLYEFCGDR